MTGLFDDPNGTYLVLVNAENQHSLWPESVAIPAGWSVTYGPAARDESLEYVKCNWTDQRPTTLISQMER